VLSEQQREPIGECRVLYQGDNPIYVSLGAFLGPSTSRTNLNPFRVTLASVPPSAHPVRTARPCRIPDELV
jgi:hypothetical protein